MEAATREQLLSIEVAQLNEILDLKRMDEEDAAELRRMRREILREILADMAEGLTDG